MTAYWRAPNGNEFRILSETPGRGRNPDHGPKRKAHRMIEHQLDGPSVESGTLTLTMAPPSVNSLFHNRKQGRGKTLAYRNWRAFADRELRDQPSWHVPGKVRIVVRSSSGTDIDNRLKASLDALVGAGRIEGDSPKHVIDARTIHDPAVTGTLIDLQQVMA